MKKIILMAALVMSVSTAAVAASVVTSGDYKNLQVSNIDVQRDGSSLNVAFTIDASAVDMKSNQELYITPTLSNAEDEVTLPPVLVAGRNRMYYHMRNDNEWIKDVNMFHNGADAGNINYSAIIPYQQWMNLSELGLDLTDGGCANCVAANGGPGSVNVPLAAVDMRPAFFAAEYVYTAPKGDGVKIRKESGSAYIDFKVGKSEILPDFRNNATELAKISNTIDKVKNDKDYTITSVNIKGYASPEGAETLNQRLSGQRAASLMNYVKGLYNFPKSVKFASAGEGEDWAGLRKWVASSNLDKKDAILAIIDNKSLTDDQKDAKIKSEFPVDYPYMLQNVYPTLRHSDYEVKYTVREFTDVNEIIGLVQTAPQKLGMNEFFLAAQTMEPGSDAYNQVFETAVRMYPDDEVANLNAANAAMSKGDMNSAAKYLKKAGKSEAANYARGVYSALNKDYEVALEWFSQAPTLSKQKGVIDQVRKCIDRPEGKVIVKPLQ